MVASRSFMSPAGTIPISLLVLAGVLSSVAAQTYKIGSRDEIVDSARTLAFDLMKFYTGNETGEVPGLLPGPPSDGTGDYYFSQSGAFWGTYIDYWRLTGDDTYNNIVTQGLLHQVGQYDNFVPINQSLNVYNDDQCMWALSAMLAAESRFPSPPADKPQWVSLAKQVFNELAIRFDIEDEEGTCDGGLRWAIFPSAAGYNYKTTQANGCFFNLGARLARYTGNDTYAEYAERTWDWMYAVGLIDHDKWRVYDGGHAELNCTDTNKATFSTGIAWLAQASAFMYNYTEGSDIWRDRVVNLVSRFQDDFITHNGAVFEVPCERRVGTCAVDMLMFKGLAHRWLASSTQVAPFVGEGLLPALRTSAQLAVSQCTGGSSKRQCGFYWSSGKFVDPKIDGTSGASEQMNVLGAVSSLLISEADVPAVQSDGSGAEGSKDDAKTGESEPGSGSDGSSSSKGNGSDGSPDGGSVGSVKVVSLLAVLSSMGVWGVMNL